MIDSSAIDAFQRDGAICLRQLFTPDEIERLRTGIDAHVCHFVAHDALLTVE
jgi:hypothetical protein